MRSRIPIENIEKDLDHDDDGLNFQKEFKEAMAPKIEKEEKRRDNRRAARTRWIEYLIVAAVSAVLSSLVTKWVS